MAGREAQRNSQRLEYKFITEYIRCTNKDIYDEANSFYQMVKSNNPRVHDLTKTVEFMERAKPNLYIPRYYYNRKGRKTTPTKQTEQIMCLNIPLMTTPLPALLTPPTEEPTQSPQPMPAAVEPSQPSAEPTPVQLTEEPTQSPQPMPAAVEPSQPSAEPTPVQLTEEPTQSPQPMPAAVEPSQPSAEPTPVQLTEEPIQSPQPTPAAEEPLQSPPPTDPSPVQLTEDPLPPLSEEQYHQLILELNQDLDMMFANFDIPGVNDEDMNPQVWNEIQINTTPMEIA